MSRFRYEMTEQKIEQWIKEGRGKGEGKNYKPFLTVFDFSSDGSVNRNPGVKTGRTEHVFSQNEEWTLSVASLSVGIVDINEQFPLLPLEETIEIARLLSIKHPVFQDHTLKKEVTVVLTTDFCFTIQLPNGEKGRVARTVKMNSDLSSYRTIEKLEIERVYWKSRNVDWGIIIADILPKYFVKNCMDLIPFYLFDPLNIPHEDVSEIFNYLTPVVLLKKQSLRLIAKDCDNHFGLKRGTSIKACRHFVATQKWVVNLNQLLDPSEILEIQSASENY